MSPLNYSALLSIPTSSAVNLATPVVWGGIVGSDATRAPCMRIITRNQGGPGSVRLRFGDGTVRAVPVFGSGCSSKEGVLVCFSTVSQKGRFQFRFRFLENGFGGSGSGVQFLRKQFRRFRFPVPVRFLGHPEKCHPRTQDVCIDKSTSSVIMRPQNYYLGYSRRCLRTPPPKKKEAM